jgi:hypothetical protein
VGRDGEAPKDVAELLSQPIATNVSILKYPLSNQPQNLRGLLGEARARVQQAIALVE